MKLFKNYKSKKQLKIICEDLRDLSNKLHSDNEILKELINKSDSKNYSLEKELLYYKEILKFYNVEDGAKVLNIKAQCVSYDNSPKEQIQDNLARAMMDYFVDDIEYDVFHDIRNRKNLNTAKVKMMIFKGGDNIETND